MVCGFSRRAVKEDGEGQEEVAYHGLDWIERWMDTTVTASHTREMGTRGYEEEGDGGYLG